MILVTGATGHLGNATISFLLEKMPASQIAALVRDEAKAAGLRELDVDVRTGDYNDYASLVKAFTGIDKLFLISSSDMQGDRSVQHINAINAAKEAGVKHIVYTSIDMRDFEHTVLTAVADAHVKTVAHLKRAGIPFSLMNNTLYADVLPMFLGDKVLETGVFFPAGDGKTPFTARTDMAEAAASILADGGHESRIYTIASDTGYSFYDIAAILSELSGREVAYINPATETYTEQLTKAGTPAQFTGFLAAFGEAISNKDFETGKTDLETVLGRKPLSLRDYLKSVYFPSN